jgi:hypothetical protein
MKNLSEAFWRLRHRLCRERAPEWHASVRAAGFYPAYADWVGVFALDTEGVAWFTPHPANWRAAERVQEPELVHVARAQAARWTPAMRAFLPARDETARLCPSCRGSGHPATSARHWSTFICECGGLGWVPAAWRSDHTSAGRWATHGTDQPPV